MNGLTRVGAIPPARIVHLGLGNFTRAHQAWYTEHAADAAQWGIAGFRGRANSAPTTRDAALTAHEGCYLLDIMHPAGDQVEAIGALCQFHDGADTQGWVQLFCEPQVTLVTSTITEAGYCLGTDGGLDLAKPQLVRDLDLLSHAGSRLAGLQMYTGPGKILLGLIARRRADAGSITLVPCDNVPGNGALMRAVIEQAADRIDPDLREWVEQNVGFVTTMVDRITPRATHDDIDRVAALTGVRDEALVVTEPFSQWVLSGTFTAGRPSWESSGARFVDNIAPFEQRKLFLLNGSHSLMAYAASVLGYQTIYEAVGDDAVVAWVNQWWDAAVTQIELPPAELADYRNLLMERYRNTRIRHLLAQIAADGSLKLPIRVVPVVRAFAAQGKACTGGTRVIAAWLLHLRGQGAPVNDPNAEALSALVGGSLKQAAANLVGYLRLDSPEVVAAVAEQACEMEAIAAQRKIT